MSRLSPRCSKTSTGLFPVVHEADTAIDAVAEITEQVAKTAGKAPLNILRRNIVPAMGNALNHAQFRHFDVGQGQINQFHPPAVPVQLLDQVQIATSRQGGFKSEILTGRDAYLDLPQKERLAANNSRSGASGESPAAIRSALMKCVQPATRGRYSNAKVVLPAPLGPAMIQQVGVMGTSPQWGSGR